MAHFVKDRVVPLSRVKGMSSITGETFEIETMKARAEVGCEDRHSNRQADRLYRYNRDGVSGTSEKSTIGCLAKATSKRVVERRLKESCWSHVLTLSTEDTCG